eukprot:534763_1
MFEGNFFVDSRLPFGCRSSAGLHGSFSKLVAWIATHVFGWDGLYVYCDDYLGVSPLQYVTYTSWVLDLLFCLLGIQDKPSKRFGPGFLCKHLGWLINTLSMDIRVPPEKVARILQKLKSFVGRMYCSLKELQRIVGHLSFFAAIITSGRVYIARIIELLKGDIRNPLVIPLSEGCRRDVRWWVIFLSGYSGVSLMKEPFVTSAIDFHVGCDSTLKHGGAFFRSSWFSIPWFDKFSGHNIAFFELLTILVACATWGHLWSKKRLLFHCDNVSAVATIRSRRVDSPRMNLLSRTLSLLEARHDFLISAVYVPGKENSLADKISRGKFDAFRQEFFDVHGYAPNPLPCTPVWPVFCN